MSSNVGGGDRDGERREEGKEGGSKGRKWGREQRQTLPSKAQSNHGKVRHFK